MPLILLHFSRNKSPKVCRFVNSLPHYMYIGCKVLCNDIAFFVVPSLPTPMLGSVAGKSWVRAPSHGSTYLTVVYQVLIINNLPHLKNTV